MPPNHQEFIVVDVETSGIAAPVYVIEIGAQLLIDGQPHGEPHHVSDHLDPHGQPHQVPDHLDPHGQTDRVADAIHDRHLVGHHFGHHFGHHDGNDAVLWPDSVQAACGSFDHQRILHGSAGRL